MKNIARVIVSAIALLGSPAAFATSVFSTSGTTYSNNLTFYGPGGAVFGGSNDMTVIFNGTWATSITSSPSTISGAIYVDPPAPFFGNEPIFHDMQLFKGPASSTDPAATYNVPSNLCSPCAFPPPSVLTVGLGQVGIHVLMDWGTSTNIDIIGVLLDPAPVQGPVYTGGPGIQPVYDLVAIDSDGDGIPGWKLFEGPLAGYSIGMNFNVPAPAVPVPAAAWLLAPGLLGLLGVARRKA